MPPSPSAQAASPLIYLSTHYIRAKEYLEAIVASTADAICTTDVRGRVIYFSPGAERMLGFKAMEVVGTPVRRLYQGGRTEAEKVAKLLLRQGGLTNYETVLVGRERRVHVSVSASLLRDREGRVIGTLGIAKDITERVELERRLRELSITDNLTGLFNQRHFSERLVSEMQRARRQHHGLSLLLFDLDGFKRINDSRGHLEGDRVLRGAAEALRRSIRAGVDAAFRYGGDEFVLLLPGLGLRQADGVVRRVRHALQAQVTPAVTFSVGAAALRPGDTPDSILRRADARMYAAKKKAQRRLP